MVGSERCWDASVGDPKKSIARWGLELGIPKTTIQNVIHKCLRLYAYKTQLKHEIKPDDWPKRYDFASIMLNKINDDETSLRMPDLFHRWGHFSYEWVC
jgi:hypothetical protein